jgi:hypothetical protein
LAVSSLSAFALALAKADAGGLLVHRRDRLVLLALLRAYAPALADTVEKLARKKIHATLNQD